MVDFAPAIVRQEAIAEMADAAGLLLFQGRDCNRQIPAKVYEYLLCGRPIIGLADRNGDTWALLNDEWRVPYLADMNSPEEIAETLATFLDDLRAGRPYIPPSALIQRHSRRQGAIDLGKLIDRLTGPRSA